MYSYGAPPTLTRDGRYDDKDELEDASFIEDGYSVATEDSYWEYAVNGFTKTYQEFTKAINKFDEKTHQEFTMAINKFDESAAIKCKETADIIDDTANWKFPKEHRDVRPLRDAYDKSGRYGVTNAKGYTTATNVTDATGKTGYTTKSGRSGTTEVTATNATGLTGPTRERSEKYTSIEVAYNSEADRTLVVPQVTKKTRECERSVPSNFSKKSRATRRSGLMGPTRERSEKYTSIEVVYNSQVDRTLEPKVTKKTRECERSVPSNLSEKSSKKSRATQRSSIFPTASFEDRSLAQTILSDLTITGRPGRDESYFTSRFVLRGNAKKATAPIAEDVLVL